MERYSEFYTMVVSVLMMLLSGSVFAGGLYIFCFIGLSFDEQEFSQSTASFYETALNVESK